MRRYRQRITKTISNLSLERKDVEEVIESVEKFLKEGMDSMTMFALRIPGIGTWKLNRSHRDDTNPINDFDMKFIKQSELELYERKRREIEHNTFKESNK